MGFFTLVALILVAAKAFGFLGLSWAWCFAPVLVDVALVVLALGAGLFTARKTANIMADNVNYDELRFGMAKIHDDGYGKEKDRL